MTRMLLTYGDSNTYGSTPLKTLSDPHTRFDSKTRWSCRAAAELGSDWELAEHGLPGRTTNLVDPVMGDYMDGRIGLKIALESAGLIDVLTIMLGTNDTKAAFGATAESITGGAAGLLSYALDARQQNRHGGFKILLMCPAPVVETGCLSAVFYGAHEKSKKMAALYEDMARVWGVDFLDVGKVTQVSPVDGVHFEPEGHEAIGKAVAAKIREMVG